MKKILSIVLSFLIAINLIPFSVFSLDFDDAPPQSPETIEAADPEPEAENPEAEIPEVEIPEAEIPGDDNTPEGESIEDEKEPAENGDEPENSDSEGGEPDKAADNESNTSKLAATIKVGTLEPAAESTYAAASALEETGKAEPPKENPSYGGFIADPTAEPIPGGAIHIKTASELASIGGAQSAGKYYVLDNNINLTDEWVPIGDFRGTLNGQGYSVNNLYVLESSKRGSAGLFGTVSHNNVAILNLAVNIGEKGVAAVSSGFYSYAGGLAGYFSFPSSSGTVTVTNCYVTGNVSAVLTSGSAVYAGGLIGRSDSNSNSIENCYATGEVYSASTDSGAATAGGLVGYFHYSSNFSSSFSQGNVSASSAGTSSSTAGGLVGNSNSSITAANCFATGNVSAGTVGGLVGHALYSATFTDCFATGNVLSKGPSSFAYAGGIIGDAPDSSPLIITNCYAAGDVSVLTGTYIHAGGLIGSASASNTITGSSTTGDVSAVSSSTTTSSYAYAGGLVGSFLYTGESFISNCSSKGIAQAKTKTERNNYAGGIVGRNGRNSTLNFVSPCSYSSANSLMIGYNEGAIANLDYVMVINYNPTFNPARDKAFKLTVFDDGTGQPIEGATISISDLSVSTGPNGEAEIMGLELNKNLSFTVEMEGFHTYSEYVIVPSNGVTKTISLSPIDNNIYISNVSVRLPNKSMKSILRESELIVDNTDRDMYDISVGVEWNDNEPGDIVILNQKKSFKFEGYDLSLAIGNVFQVNDDIYIKASSADGKKSAIKQVQIDIIELPVDLSIVLPEFGGTPVPGDVPFLGGMEFLFSLGENLIEGLIPEIDSGKLIFEIRKEDLKKITSKKLALLDDHKIGIDVGLRFEIPIKDIENGVWRGYFFAELSGGKAKKPDKGGGDNGGGDSGGGDNGGGDSGGGDNGNDNKKLIPLTDVSYNFTLPPPVSVPMFVTLKLSAGAELDLGATLSRKDGFEFDGSITPKIGADVYGGVGFIYRKAEVTAGAYGKAEILGTIEFSPPAFKPSLELSLGARATLKVWKFDNLAEYEFVKLTWPDRPEYSFFAEPSASSQWELISRKHSYDSGGFAASGSVSPLALFSDTPGVIDGMIYENMFLSAESVLEVIDDTPYIIFNEYYQKDGHDALRLMYTSHDGDEWSVPATIAEDAGGLLDTAISSGGNLVAWERLNGTSLPETPDNLADIMKDTEIYAAVLDENGWQSEQLSNPDNDYAKFAPVAASSGDGSAVVAWLSNTESDIFCATGTTSLHYVLRDGTQWSAAQAIADIGAVDNIEAASNDGNAVLAFVKAADLNEETGLYSKLYYINTEEESTVNALDVPSGLSSYQIAYFDGKYILAYFDGSGKLTVVDDFLDIESGGKISVETNEPLISAPVIAVKDNEIYICWTDREESGNVLSGVRFSNGEWSERMTLVYGGEDENGDKYNIRKPGVAFHNENLLAMYFLESPVNIVEGADSELEISGGQLDLYCREIAPTYDLTLIENSLEYDEALFALSGRTYFDFTVRNSGQKTINGLTVTISQGESSQTINVDETLTAGEYEDLSVLTRDTLDAAHDVAVTVQPSKEEEALGQNSENSCVVSLGSIDASVESAYFTIENVAEHGTVSEKHMLNAEIKNAGTFPIEEIKVSVIRGDEEGPPVYEESFEDVIAGEVLLLRKPLDIDSMIFNEKDYARYFVTVEADGDKTRYNDSVLAVADKIVETKEPNLESVTVPEPLTDIPNGTSLESIAQLLPETAELVTDVMNITTGVSWDIDAAEYDPDKRENQTFTVAGSVSLPGGVTNNDNIPLTVQISITVNAGDDDPDDPDSPAFDAVSVDYTLEQITGITAEMEYRFGTGVWILGTGAAVDASPYFDDASTDRYFTVRLEASPSNERVITLPQRRPAPQASYDSVSKKLTASVGAVYSIDDGYIGEVPPGGATIEPPVTGVKIVTVWLPADENAPKSAEKTVPVYPPAVPLAATKLFVNNAEASLIHNNIVTSALRITSNNPDAKFKLDDASLTVTNCTAKDGDGYYGFIVRNNTVGPVTISKRVSNKAVDFAAVLTIKDSSGEVGYKIISDTQKPTLENLKLPGSYDAKKAWTGDRLPVEILVRDDGSGIRGITWSTNEKPAQSGAVTAAQLEPAANGYLKYTLNLSRQGKYRLTVTAYDHTGKFVSKSVNISIDNASPEDVRLKINRVDSPDGETFYTAKALRSISVSATAVAAGKIKALEFGVGDTEPAQWLSLTNLKKLDAIKDPENKQAKLWIKVTSRTNNKFVVLSRDIRVVTPTVKKNTSVKAQAKDLDANALKRWQNSDITIDITASADYLDGLGIDPVIAKTTYKTSLKGAVETEFAGNSFTLSENGSYRVTVYAYDALGARASAKAIAVRIDKEPPDIKNAIVKAGGKVIEIGSTIVQSKAFALSVRPRRQSSKVIAEWSSDNGATWKPVKERITASENGKKIRIRLSNEAGVTSDTSADFATVHFIDAKDPRPAELTVKLGSRLASIYGNTVTRACALNISTNLKANALDKIEYQLSYSALPPPDNDVYWHEYNSRAKPLLNKNMEVYLHVKLTPNTGEAISRSFPVTVELSEKAGFLSLFA